MNAEHIMDAMNLVDEKYRAELLVLRRQSEPKRRRRLGRTLLIAAAIASALIVSAFAVGYTLIHTRRQEELHQSLEISENAVADYVEYPVSELDRSEGVTLLSTINDGEFQRVYMNIGPITREELDTFFLSPTQNGDGSFSFYMPQFTQDGIHFGTATPIVLDYTPGETAGDMLSDAYDEETQTLTVECDCIDTEYDFSKPFTLTLQLMYCTDDPEVDGMEAEIVRTFGTVTVDPTVNSARFLRFAEPYCFTNETTGGEGSVIGAEISSMSVNLIVEHENMETMYVRNELTGEEQRRFFEEQLGWVRAVDEVFHGLTLEYPDGSTQSGFGSMSADYADGHAVHRCGLGSRTLNADAVVGISIGETKVYG